VKILNVVQRYPPAVGGSETWCQEVCRWLAQKGHQVTVLTLDVNEEEEFWRDPHDQDRTLVMGKLTLDRDVRVRRYQRSLPIPTVHHGLFKRLLDHFFNIYFYGPHSWEMYAKMWREIKHAHIVVLHTLPYPHNYVGYFFARMFGKKVALVPHFHPDHPHYERPSNYWLLRKADRVIAVSEFEKEYLAARGVESSKISVAGNAIHPDEYRPDGLHEFRRHLFEKYGLQPDDLMLTFVGRKMRDKGVSYLIEAVKRLGTEVPIKLFIVGPSSEWFNELYAKLSPDNKKFIIDLGVLPQQQKVNLLHLADLLVLPSKFEAFGIVFLEAWICSVPVLGSNRGAMPRLIANEGFIAEYGDVDDLAATIARALLDKDKLRSMGVSGKEKVLSQYTWDAIGAKAEQAVVSLCKKRVLICTNAYPPNFIGGAELVAHYQARALRSLGHDVAVFAGNLNAHAPRHSMRKKSYEGMPVYRVVLHSKDYSSDFINFSNTRVEELFDSALREFAPDVVHFHNIVGLSVGLLEVAKRNRLHTILTVHDHWGFCFKNTLIKSEGEICTDTTKCEQCMAFIPDDGERRIPIRMRKDFITMQLEKVDDFISPSAYLAQSYCDAAIGKGRFHVVSNGIDVDRFSSSARISCDGVLRLTYIGYLGRHKGVQVIIDALEYLPATVSLNFTIVGEGPERETLKRRVRAMGWDGKVNFRGRIPNSRIGEIFRETDVFILPSIWPENQPVSITEAMAARIPVIASRIGGISELVDDGVTGLLFDAGDARQLAQKIMHFADHPEAVETFGESAFQKVKSNTFASQVRKIEEIYRQPAKTVKEQRDLFVACVGKEVDSMCAAVMEDVASQHDGRIRFVMQNWLNEDELRLASLAWVVDAGATLKMVLPALQAKLPLLVPESNQELGELCRIANCGLWYADRAEAVECVNALLRELTTASALASNSLRFV
jgi:glycosyltransferase involved in cell wall biosynthesis